MAFPTDLYFGASAAWDRLRGEIATFAPTGLPLVLLGPTGCGKTALAGYIHHLSGRPGQLVEHSLGSVPDALAYSAFLGHTRGAFTGASDRHAGLLETAKDGTLFLDETGLATAELQRLLLGLMEGRPFTPLGASRSLTVNVRFLFATNADPEYLVAQGKWQADFYYRLGGNFLRLPGLSERRVDILPLADLFLYRRLRALGRSHRAVLSPEVEAIFLRHPWPGNIRQLQGVCDRLAVLARSDRPVGVADLTPEFLAEVPPRAVPSLDPAVARVYEVLRRHAGNKAAAARELGMHRTDLYRFLERHPRHSPSGGVARPA